MAGVDRTALLVVAGVVLAMAIGQLLFKATALSWQQQGQLWALPVMWRLALALSVYGLATLAWIWVLQRVPLTVAYPVVALTFVLVPLGARLAFGEQVGLRYYFGALLIVAGIAFAGTAKSGD